MRSTLIRSILALLATAALIVPPAQALAEPQSGGPFALGAGGGTARVRMIDNAFRPGRITIQRGTRVRWRNRGDNPHTTTSNTGLWDSGILVPGESFTRRFRRAGTFRYFCSVHANMTGRIVVTR